VKPTVYASRVFSSHSSVPVERPHAPEITRHVRLTYTPQLMAEPVVTSLRRRFGVGTSVGEATINHNRGWVELEIVGVAAGVEAALEFLRQSQVAFEDAGGPRTDTQAAAA
jgi:hypothetical protein